MPLIIAANKIEYDKVCESFQLSFLDEIHFF